MDTYEYEEICTACNGRCRVHIQYGEGCNFKEEYYCPHCRTQLGRISCLHVRVDKLPSLPKQ